MFDAFVGDVDIQKQDLGSEGTDVVSAGVATCGVVGKTTKKARRIEVLSLTMDMFGNVFLRDTPYVMVTHARVFAMLPKDNRFGRRALLYVAALLSYCRQVYSFSSMATWRGVQDKSVSLPITEHGEPDFAYMETFIRALEQERLDRLDAYFRVSNLDTCVLDAEEEEKSLLGWAPSHKSFCLGDLFDIHPTAAYKMTNAHLFAQGGQTPVLSNGSSGNGIAGYSSLHPTESGGKITFSDTTTDAAIFYQPDDFIGYPHVQGLYPKGNEAEKWNAESLLYVVALFRKCARGRFDYATKFTRKLAAAMTITLPVTEQGEIDFAYIHAYIRAIMKGAVYKVVAWKDREIDATQQICSSTSQN